MYKYDIDNDYFFLKVGALLHDIGHLVPNPEGSVKGHAEMGFDFLNSFVNTKDFSLFAKYHHALSFDEIKEEGLSHKKKNLLFMVSEASLLSLGGKTNVKENANDTKKHLLKSVFSGISEIRDDVEDFKPKFYEPKKLNPSVFTYPNLGADDPACAEEGCGRIYESFRDFFTKLSGSGINKINEDLLLMFLEENSAFIPAGRGDNEDISLFDHLKTTCAIASCIYKFHEGELDENLEEKIKERDSEKYLLVGGDVSGIQDFIYRISSKGAMRLLRGRSFYLEMFCEDIVHEIIERLGLPKANILYSGGGNFFLLAPNTEEVKKKLEEIGTDLEDWLITNRLSSSLYLALSWIPFSGENFGNFSPLWTKINQENSLRKSRKYQSVLEKDPSKILKLGDNGDPCGACRKITPSEDLEKVDDEEEEVVFCPLCIEQTEIGRKLAKFGDSFYIIKRDQDNGLSETFSKLKIIEKEKLKKKKKPFVISAPFSKLKLVEKGKLEKVRNPSVIYAVNSFDMAEIIDLIKSKKLASDIRISFLPIAIYCSKPEDRESEKEIFSFEELAEKSKGAEKLGAVRMDVDNLGKIFTLGLLKEKRTTTRVSNLSRMMNYFFKGYLNLLGEFDDKSVLDICNWQSNSPKLAKKRGPGRNFSIIYAGGDDLFIIGAWDDVFELSFDIESLFHRYVAENPHITISAGYSIFNNKHPLYQIARTCGYKEECSKDEGRNRIYLLDRGVGKTQICRNLSDKNDKITIEDSISWKEARKLFADFKPLFWPVIDKGEFSKSMIRKLLDSREEYCTNPKQFNWIMQLHYYISRNRDLKRILDDTRNEELRKYFYSAFTGISPIYNIDLPLNILDLRGRKVNE